MSEAPLDPADFGAAFRAFIDAMTEAAEKPENPLHERILAHLGMVPSDLPVVTEEYDDFEHPNLQLAIDEYITQPDRHAELVGLGGVNKQFQGFGLTAFRAASNAQRLPGSPGFAGRFLGRRVEGRGEYRSLGELTVPGPCPGATRIPPSLCA